MRKTDEAGFVVLDAPEDDVEATVELPPDPNESKRAKRKRERECKRAEKRRRKGIKKRTKRKKKLFMPILILLFLLATAAGCAANILYCRSTFDVNFYQVESTRAVRDLRIVVLSDLHGREYGSQNNTLIESVQSLHPDLIISAGDMVTYGVKSYDGMLYLCTQLSKIAPLYGVMGNHEDEKVYLEKDDKLRDHFAQAGMHLLINEVELVAIGDRTVELVGISGSASGFDQYGGKSTMDALPDNRIAFRICICHVPSVFKDRLSAYDFDLGIAGHTHGGLIRIPIIGGLYDAEEGFLPEFDGGLYTLDNAATLFVSRGLGDSGQIPRFNNTPELAVIDVRWY